jgi:serine/threonine protein kinase
MEYCGGGDLSGIIKQAQKHNRPVPEDTIWNYFMQILLALQHCHHPPNLGPDSDGKERRPQILHRDLKPDNGACLVRFCDLAHASPVHPFAVRF